MPLDDLPQVPWFKSSWSADKGNCVEVAHLADSVAMRDSKSGDNSRVLLFTAARWNAFIDRAKNGEFDRH